MVASLNSPSVGNQYALNLQGHRLAVRSGGIFSTGDIINGQLTAGDGQNAELIIRETRRIDANIVDNGAEGSVALVAHNQYGLVLAGVNTYTGGTWVVGNSSHYSTNEQAKLFIENLAAIPANDRVHLDRGSYEVKLSAPGEVVLSEIHARNNGTITGSNATLRAGAYYFESGRIGLPLAGAGTIYKDSTEHFEFGEGVSSPNFTGEVQVAREPCASTVIRFRMPASLWKEAGFSVAANLTVSSRTILPSMAGPCTAIFKGRLMS